MDCNCVIDSYKGLESCDKPREIVEKNMRRKIQI